MPVRGTSIARHAREIIIRERGQQEGERIVCAWADCDNDAVQLHQVCVYDHYRPGYGPPSRYAFCSEQCRQYFLRSHRPGQYGRLPPGMRGRWL
jgi:hypothetical protein